MQKISLPPLRSGIQVSVAAREPPQRSWSRYKKVLIDNPRDSNLLERQKLWNFQKLNRGAFRSQISSLPDIPYRVHTNTAEKVSVGVQADLSQRFNQGLRVLFPNLAARREQVFSVDSDDSDDDSTFLANDQHHKACSPMRTHDDTNLVYSDDFESASDIELDDPGFEYDNVSVIRRQNAGTMTDPKTKSATKTNKKKEKRKRSVKERNAVVNKQKPILKTLDTPRSESERKNVQFESDQNKEPLRVLPPPPISLVKERPLLPHTEPEIESADEKEEDSHPIKKIDIVGTEPERPISREPSSSSEELNEDLLRIPLDKIGHSSHLSLENLSILDILSGSKTDRSRTRSQWRSLTSRDEKISSTNVTLDADADRNFYQQIVGDKDVIDTGTYSNFARTRPNPPPESMSDSNNDKCDFSKNPTRKPMPTPRVNDEFPAYRQVKNNQAKSQSQNSSGTQSVNKSRSSRRTMIGIGKFY